MNSYRETYRRDGAGRDTAYIDEVWKDGAWRNDAYTARTYDVNGDLIRQVSAYFVYTGWRNSTRLTYTYDTNHNQLTSLIESWQRDDWTSYSRDSSTYNSKGRLTSYLYQYWSGSVWMDNTRQSYVYDARGHLITAAFNHWVKEESAWTPFDDIFRMTITDDANTFHYFPLAYRYVFHYKLIDAAPEGSLTDFALFQNYPNPFNPSTTIRYALPKRSHVTLTVFTLLGQKVTELVDGQMDAGYHEVEFNASNLASGVYFYRLEARFLSPAESGTGSFVQTRKLLLVR